MEGPLRLEVGHVTRPHGLRGEVVVHALTNRAERFAPGAVLYAGDRTLVVEQARRHQDRVVVAFEGVHNRDAAEALRGLLLTGDPLGPLDEGELWLHELVGAEVVDQEGASHGRVVAIEANPAHDILVLDSGGLVPVVFVVEGGPERVVVDAPEGLFAPEFVEANRPAVERRTPARKGGARRRPPLPGAP